MSVSAEMSMNPRMSIFKPNILTYILCQTFLSPKHCSASFQNHGSAVSFFQSKTFRSK